jgi:hypothetical protein
VAVIELDNEEVDIVDIGIGNNGVTQDNPEDAAAQGAVEVQRRRLQRDTKDGVVTNEQLPLYMKQETRERKQAEAAFKRELRSIKEQQKELFSKLNNNVR